MFGLSLLQIAGIVTGILLLKKVYSSKITVEAKQENTASTNLVSSPKVSAPSELVKTSIGYDDGILINPVSSSKTITDSSGSVYPVYKQEETKVFTPINTDTGTNKELTIPQQLEQQQFTNEYFS